MSDLRMPTINNVMIAGNLTRDPELRYLQSGSALCKLGLAVNRRYRSKDGEQREEVLFINVTTWGKTAECCGESLKKGRPVLVEGRLQSNEWEDKNTGQKRTSIEVNAIRVEALSWDDEPRATTKPGQRTTDELVPENSIPF